MAGTLLPRSIAHEEERASVMRALQCTEGNAGASLLFTRPQLLRLLGGHLRARPRHILWHFWHAAMPLPSKRISFGRVEACGSWHAAQ